MLDGKCSYLAANTLSQIYDIHHMKKCHPAKGWHNLLHSDECHNEGHAVA